MGGNETHELLVLELLGDIPGAGPRHLDPGLGEHRADEDGERDVDRGVDWVEDGEPQRPGGRHVVGDARRRGELRGVLEGLPDAEQLDEEVLGEAAREHLGDDEDVAGERGLEHDGHVARVEELDGVRHALAAEAVRLERDLEAEALEVDDDAEDDGCCEEVHDVREAVAPECFAERTALVVPGEEEMEERDDGAFELGPAPGVDRRGRERLPDDGLADVRGDEERNARAKTVAFLEELVQQDDDE